MSRLIAEDLKTISIFQLRKWGLLHVGENTYRQVGSIEWSVVRVNEKYVTDSAVYDIQYKDSQPLELTLQYSSNVSNQSYDYPISIVSTSCNYGNQRYWLKCPGTITNKCGKRVAKLYLFNNLFSCRHCLNLTYEGNNRNKRSRLFDGVLGNKTEDKLVEHLSRTKRFVYAGKPTKKALKLQQYQLKKSSRAAAWIAAGSPI